MESCRYLLQALNQIDHGSITARPVDSAPNRPLLTPYSPEQRSEVRTHQVSRADNKIEHQMLAEARDDVLKADAKASMVLAALGIGVGAVLGGILAGEWAPGDLSHDSEVFWWIASALVALAIGAAGLAVWPRYNASDGSAGIYYWAHIASFDSLSALSAALDADDSSDGDRTRNQMYSLSRIVRKKYRLIRASMLLTLGGVVLLLVTTAADGAWN